MLSPFDIETIIQEREDQAELAMLRARHKVELEDDSEETRGSLRATIARVLLTMSVSLDPEPFESRAEASVTG